MLHDVRISTSSTSRQRLRVLWFSHFIPYPPKGGCFQRSYNLIKGLSRYHDVDLLALRHKSNTHPSQKLDEARSALAEYCGEVTLVDISERTKPLAMALLAGRSVLARESLSVGIFSSEDVERSLVGAMSRRGYDVVQFDTISLAQYLQHSEAAVNILTHHGPESFMLKRRIDNERNVAKRVLFRLESKSLRAFEQDACPRFACNIVMSELDKRIMLDIAPGARFEVVGNGVDESYFAEVPDCPEPSLIFAGRMDQFSNRVGILYFLKQIWPSLTKRHPNIKFHVLGMNPPKELLDSAARDDRIVVTGFVDDIRPYFARAAICVCPNLDGGGTRLKILDALAMGMPIVTTSVACEGIDAEDGKHLLIADSPDSFSRSVSKLLDQPGLRSSLGKAARRLAVDKYAWSSLSARLANLVSELGTSATPIPAD